MTNWQALEFRHLEYAIAVERHKGFLQASFVLEIDQGSLSKHIKALERRIGFVLFDRSTRPLGLTKPGKVFLERAKQIIAQTEKAIDLALEIEKGNRGRLDIGINTSIANSALPNIVRSFRQQFPNVEIVLHELASYNQLERLRSRQIDIGFFHRHTLRNLAEEDESFCSMNILSESFVLVLPEKHPLASRPKISMASLDGHNFVLPPSALLYGLREQIDSLCRKANCKPIVVQEAAWITTVLSLVAGNMGVSLLPANVKHLQRTGVVYREVKEALPTLEIAAVWLSNSDSPSLKRFIRIIEGIRGEGRSR